MLQSIFLEASKIHVIHSRHFFLIRESVEFHYDEQQRRQQRRREKKTIENKFYKR